LHKLNTVVNLGMLGKISSYPTYPIAVILKMAMHLEDPERTASARGLPMGRRVEDEGGSECRPVIERIGVEPPGEIIPRESGLTSLGCLRTRPSEQLAWETEQMTAACCWCGLRRVTPVSPRPVSCRWCASAPPGPARGLGRGMSGINRKVYVPF